MSYSPSTITSCHRKGETIVGRKFIRSLRGNPVTWKFITEDGLAESAHVEGTRIRIQTYATIYIEPCRINTNGIEA